jgi:hypothetical protein
VADGVVGHGPILPDRRRRPRRHVATAAVVSGCPAGAGRSCRPRGSRSGGRRPAGA